MLYYDCTIREELHHVTFTSSDEDTERKDSSNDEDQESNSSYVSGLVLSEIPTKPSNWRSNIDLSKYLEDKKIVCIAVNDPNVMKAWGENQNVGNKILMAGDPFLKFTKAIGAEVDKSAKGLGIRSNRYTILVENDVCLLYTSDAADE